MVNYVCHRNDRSTLRGGTMLLVRHDDHYLVPFSNLRQMGGQLSSWRSMYVSSRKKYVCTLPDIDRNPPVSKPYFQFREVGLQIIYQKCWMLRRCYQSIVISILGQFYVAGRRWNVVHIQTEDYRRYYSPLRQSNPHELTGIGGHLKRPRHKGAGVQLRGDYFHLVLREFKETLDPYGNKSFSHMNKNCATEPLLDKISFVLFK